MTGYKVNIKKLLLWYQNYWGIKNKFIMQAKSFAVNKACAIIK